MERNADAFSYIAVRYRTSPRAGDLRVLIGSIGSGYWRGGAGGFWFARARIDLR